MKNENENVAIVFSLILNTGDSYQG